VGLKAFAGGRPPLEFAKTPPVGTALACMGASGRRAQAPMYRSGGGVSCVVRVEVSSAATPPPPPGAAYPHPLNPKPPTHIISTLHRQATPSHLRALGGDP